MFPGATSENMFLSVTIVGMVSFMPARPPTAFIAIGNRMKENAIVIRP